VLVVTEVNARGSVPDLKVVNKADSSILLLDGELVKAADDLAAFMEAYLSLKNGISNSQLQTALQEKKQFYREKTIAGINLGNVYKDFH